MGGILIAIALYQAKADYRWEGIFIQELKATFNKAITLNNAILYLAAYFPVIHTSGQPGCSNLFNDYLNVYISRFDS